MCILHFTQLVCLVGCFFKLILQIIATAAHCVLGRDSNGDQVFPESALFIPGLDDGDGIGTNDDCSDDEHGCLAISFGLVSQDYATYDGYETDDFSSEFKYNFDVGFFVVEGVTTTSGDTLTPLGIDFGGLTTGLEGYALGYPADYDPEFMYSLGEIQDSPITLGKYMDCTTLGSGASGGPWLQESLLEYGYSGTSIQCIHSWIWTTEGETGAGCAPLDTGFAECLYNEAVSAALDSESMILDC